MIVVRDDLISKEVQDYLHTVVFGSEDINAMLPLTCKYETTARDGVNPLPVSFQHVFKSSTVMSNWYGNFSKIPQTVLRKLNINLVDILQARLFITVPHKTSLKHYAPHTDLECEHLALIYYVNDSDGNTVFFDDKNKIIESVTPKKGRIVLFDGHHLHAGGFPSNNPRCIVNYNLIVG
jgi:hypothetical protein